MNFVLPTGYFAITLGLSALSLAWRHASSITNYAPQTSLILSCISVVLWLLFIVLFIFRCITKAGSIKEEYNCPIRFSFFALIPITTMLVGMILLPLLPILAEILIWLGALGQIFYAFIRISVLWRGNIFIETAALPPFYLPTVATNFTAATSLALLGHKEFATFFLGAGFLAWFMFEPILLQRLRLNETLVSLRPSFGIILAPAFVGSVAYLAVNGGQVDLVVKMLWGYGFLQFVFLLRLLNWIAEKGFNFGLWAFSFGLGSMANGATYFYQIPELQIVGLVAFIIANIGIGILLFKTIFKWAKKEF
ncbi:dicarboxylate transporter/tellurite-resistance protein TehA [Pasteurellaceae bacterium 22721_9_1]